MTQRKKPIEKTPGEDEPNLSEEVNDSSSNETTEGNETPEAKDPPVVAEKPKDKKPLKEGFYTLKKPVNLRGKENVVGDQVELGDDQVGYYRRNGYID